MDSLKLKAIEYFSAKPHDDPKAKQYLESVYIDIRKILLEECEYESISSALEALDKFVSHVAEAAIVDLSKCWDRLHGNVDLVLIDDYFLNYYTKEKLYAEIVRLLGRLRYLEQNRIVPVLIEFWKEEDSTKDHVLKVFEDLAEFDLHAFQHLGFSPQLLLLDYIMRLSDEDRVDLFPIIISVYEKFLSTDIEGRDWNYRALSIKYMAIPGSEDINRLRSETVASLIGMYEYTDDLTIKKKLLSTMNKACHIWSRGQVSKEAAFLVEKSAIEVLKTWSSLVYTESLELVQKIEHDAYWVYHHSSSIPVKEAALHVESSIRSNAEYQIYRDLVGFEGIFGSWVEQSKLGVHYEDKSLERKARVKAHLDSVSKDNVYEWVRRVECYLKTDSRDLATFPELFEFIEGITVRYPKEVYSRYVEKASLDKSAVPIFRGLWASSFKDEFVQVVTGWIARSLYMKELAVSFLSFDDIDFVLMDTFVVKAIRTKDSESLCYFLRVLDARSELISNDEIGILFEKIFVYFNACENVSWVNHVWFSQKAKSLIRSLSNSNVKLVFENMVYISNLDHRVESILAGISSDHIDKIFSLFERRIEYRKRVDKSYLGRYEDIPFNFYVLDKVLANHPNEIIKLIKTHYEYNLGVANYGVAGLLKKCFTSFEQQLVDIIFEQLDPSLDDELNAILAIVSSYEGDSSVLPIIRRLLENDSGFDQDKAYRIGDSLMSTGVVHGEYGMVEAYKQKLESISPWKEDCNPQIAKFACIFYEQVQKNIDQEIKRVEERVAIEKHKYGIDDSGC